jgi:hypothetical protein
MPLVRGLETVRFGVVEPAPLPLSPQREHTDGSAPYARKGELRSRCQTSCALSQSSTRPGVSR